MKGARDSYSVIVRPVVTEKSHRLMEEAGGRRRRGKAPTRLYTFEVQPRANKIAIRKAIEELFKVKVVSVNTQRVPGKARRVGKAPQGRTRAWKKAVVRLAQGQTIEIY